MRDKSIFVAAVIATLVGSSGQAATIFATGVTWENNGTVGTGNGRFRPENALGAPDGKFLSLGLGGFADFTFGEDFTGPGVSFEVTFNNRKGYPESAAVYAGSPGSFIKVGDIDNSSEHGFTFSFTGIFDTLRLVDTSPFVNGRDGYDVDAIGVTAVGTNPGPAPVPLPATVLLLAAGIAGLRALRRKG